MSNSEPSVSIKSSLKLGRKLRPRTLWTWPITLTRRQSLRQASNSKEFKRRYTNGKKRRLKRALEGILALSSAKGAAMKTPVVYLSPKDLRAKGVPYGMNHLRRLWQSGKFPKPIKLSERKLVWLESEIEAYVAGKTKAI
jgi:Prophage CP4-57 regulatory protein (AlpA)